MISAWHLPNGVHARISVTALQKLSGTAFDLSVGEGEVDDAFPDWRGGKPKNCSWGVAVSPPAGHDSARDMFTSSDPGVRALPVDSLEVGTSPNGDSPGCRMESPT
jgi:hypothetical protein